MMIKNIKMMELKFFMIIPMYIYDSQTMGAWFLDIDIGISVFLYN